MEFHIGSRLKELRKSKGLSITDLAERSSVSTGLISQIERDLVVPSVVNLYRVAQALETDINYFFEGENEKKIQITRHGDHRQMITNQGNGIYQMYTSGKKGHALDLVQMTLKGGDNCSDEMISHEGEECGVVLKGVLTLLVEDQEYRLYEGDSVYFRSSIPHKYLNRESEDCVSVWAMTPTYF